MRFALLLLVAVASAGVAAQSQPPSPAPAKPVNSPQKQTESKEQAAESNKASAAQLIIVGDALAPIDRNKESESAAQKKENGASSSWSLSDKIATTLSVIALFQFFALLATWLVMRSTAKRQLRAYVHVHTKTLDVIRAGDKPNVFIRLKNTGLTPAIDVRCWLKIHIVERGFEGDFPFETTSRASRSIIPPDGEQITKDEREEPLSDQEFVEICGVNTKIIYVNGRVEYRDVFGRKCWTEYRMWSDGRTVTSRKGKEIANLVYSHNGNACDRSKKKRKQKEG